MVVVPYPDKVLDRCDNNIVSLYYHLLIGDDCRSEKLSMGHDSTLRDGIVLHMMGFPKLNEHI